jgi:hypothetical protein
MLKIAFDIDDTLIIPSVATDGNRDVPNYETIAILRWHQAQGHEIILWSGSGMDWAQTWGEKLGLMPFTVMPKELVMESTNGGTAYVPMVDIAYDDCDVKLAKVNIKVKRVKNGVSRKEWNETKRPATDDTCYLDHVEGVLTCTVNHKDGEECLMDTQP